VEKRGKTAPVEHFPNTVANKNEADFCALCAEPGPRKRLFRLFHFIHKQSTDPVKENGFQK
jgi:hypothetical protein